MRESQADKLAGRTEPSEEWKEGGREGRRPATFSPTVRSLARSLTCEKGPAARRRETARDPVFQTTNIIRKKLHHPRALFCRICSRIRKCGALPEPVFFLRTMHDRERRERERLNRTEETRRLTEKEGGAVSSRVSLILKATYNRDLKPVPKSVSFLICSCDREAAARSGSPGGERGGRERRDKLQREHRQSRDQHVALRGQTVGRDGKKEANVLCYEGSKKISRTVIYI